MLWKKARLGTAPYIATENQKWLGNNGGVAVGPGRTKSKAENPARQGVMNSPYVKSQSARFGQVPISPLAQFSVVSYPNSAAAEAFRSLQTQLYLNWLSKAGGGSVIAVVSPERKEGRSFVASNLAVLFAQSGLRCLLIDTDMRNPDMHRLFGLPRDHGLSGLLCGTHRYETFYSLMEMDTLSVLPVGEVPANPQALLQRPSFSALVEHGARNHDVVILDTPAWNSCDDAQVISKVARGALLVCKKGHTRASDAAGIVSQLSNLKVETIGSVLMQPQG